MAQLWLQLVGFFSPEGSELIFSSLILQEEEEVSDCSSVRLTDEVRPGSLWNLHDLPKSVSSLSFFYWVLLHLLVIDRGFVLFIQFPVISVEFSFWINSCLVCLLLVDDAEI